MRLDLLRMQRRGNENVHESDPHELIVPKPQVMNSVED